MEDPASEADGLRAAEAGLRGRDAPRHLDAARPNAAAPNAATAKRCERHRGRAGPSRQLSQAAVNRSTLSRMAGFRGQRMGLTGFGAAKSRSGRSFRCAHSSCCVGRSDQSVDGLRIDISRRSLILAPEWLPDANLTKFQPKRRRCRTILALSSSHSPKRRCKAILRQCKGRIRAPLWAIML